MPSPPERADAAPPAPSALHRRTATADGSPATRDWRGACRARAGAGRGAAATAGSDGLRAPASALSPGKPIPSAPKRRFDFPWVNPFAFTARRAVRPGKAGSSRRSATGARQKGIDGFNIPADRALQAQRLREARDLGPAPPSGAADLILRAALSRGGEGARDRQIPGGRGDGGLVGHDSQAPCTASPWGGWRRRCRARLRTIAELILRFQPVA